MGRAWTGSIWLRPWTRSWWHFSSGTPHIYTSAYQLTTHKIILIQSKHTLSYLTTVTPCFPLTHLTYKIVTCNEQCVCWMGHMFPHERKICPAPLNTAHKPLLAAVHWNWTYIMANWNNAEYRAACHHRKWSKWKVMWVVRWNNVPVVTQLNLLLTELIFKF